MIGKHILHYEIRSKLGQGGMGEVYHAHDTRLNRDVALKFLPESLRSDTEARERLLREAQAASRLNHPNIVSIYAIEESDGHDFIVMEYVDGRTLSDIVREGSLKIDKVFDLARQVGKALATAHEAGIVHRDIKSENILVTDKGQVKILDFGLAKLRGAARITEMTSTLGTMAYMSPEQAQGQDVDHRSDLFSFGVVLYEMIAGQLPFKGEHSAALTYAIVNESPEPLARYKSSVSEDLQRLMDKALRKDKATRYQSAADMIADLEIVSGISAVRPAPVSVGRGRSRLLVGTIVVVALAAVVFVLNRQRTLQPMVAPASADRIKMAVLPFQNLGASEDEYFADGITEEITTHLAKLSGLGVISRTSAMSYKNTDKGLQEIGRELAVDYVLEGTIRWDKSSGESRVRINPQLINVNDDTHLWAHTYDRVFSEIFALQTEIAQEVASALNVTLLEPERAALQVAPTDNMEAYHKYLRGKEHYITSVTPNARDMATRMFEEATQLDPTFAVAYAWLARIYANDYFNHRHTDQPRLEQALLAAQNALKHSNDGPEGHLAMGYYHYYASRDYKSALEEFAVAKRGEPSNSALFEASAYVLRRQGRWEEAVDNFATASELDPHNTGMAAEYVGTLTRMRRYDDATKVLERSIERVPDYWPLHIWQGALIMFETGDVVEAREAAAASERYAPASMLAQTRETIEYIAGDVDAALELRPTLEHFEGDSAGYYGQRGFLYFQAGRVDVARSYCDSARVILERQLAEDAENHDRCAQLGLALAGLGRKSDAIRYGKKAVDLLPMSKDAVSCPELLMNLAYIYAMVDEPEAAIDQLEFLMSVPFFLSVRSLQMDPAFRSLHDHPRFKALVQRYNT